MAFKTVEDLEKETNQGGASTAEGDKGAGAGDNGGQSAAAATDGNGGGDNSGSQPAVNWLDEFNKAFGTQYKGKEEIDDVFGRAKKVEEYEPKIKEYDSFTEREKQYKKQIEEANRSLNPISWFSSEEAYRAEQLRKQHPDKNPVLLQEVVAGNIKEMSDTDILVKKYLLDNPDLSEGDVRLTVYKEYDIDPENPSEVDAVSKTRMRIKANEARKEFTELKNSIEIPKILTEEEKIAKAEEARQAKAASLKPLADKFAQSDKFTAKIGDNVFEYAYPEEFKKTLNDMFTGYFLDGDLDVNEENLKAIEDMRDGVFLKYNFESIYKAIESDTSMRVKEEYDKKLNNEKPANTNSAPTDDQPGAGMASFLHRNKRV